MKTATNRRLAPRSGLLISFLAAALCLVLGSAQALADISLQLTISPSQAVDAGAQWRLDGGAWQASGATLTGITPGSHTIDYQDITGWIAPHSETVTLLGAGTVILTRDYSAQISWLMVTITPPEAAMAGAQWRVDSGPWQPSGATVNGLTPGSHTVDYERISGWTPPPSEVVAVAGATQISRAYYMQPGALVVILGPAEALTAGAQWRVDGGDWQNTMIIVNGLAPGNHSVEYKSLPGWAAPKSETVSIVNGQATQLNRTYSTQISSLVVTLTPAEAVLAGAQWRVDGGAWQTSGSGLTNLLAGSHTLEYMGLAGWLSPGSETVTTTTGQTLQLTRSYVAQSGSLSISLAPPEATAAGAQWRVDTGPWRASGSTVNGLSPGTHTVDYQAIQGWSSPPTEAVVIILGQTLALTRNYTAQPGSVSVTLLPSTVLTAGAQWRVDGGLWQDSGTTVSGLSPGGHTVDYKPVAGWNAPSTETISVGVGQTSLLSRSYNQAGPPSITTQPIGLTVTNGANVSFTVVAVGAGSVNYQWQKAGAILFGQTGPILSLSNVDLDDMADYRVLVSNEFGSVLSQPAVLTVLAAPTISVQPTDKTVMIGQDVTFTVIAKGNPAPNYRWQQGGNDIPGATNASLVLPKVQVAQALAYQVVVSNPLGTLTSSPARLTILMPPTITSQPTSVSVAVGQNVVFTSGANGTAPITYQWQKSGINLDGQNGPNLYLYNVQLADVGDYRLVASSPYGTAISDTASLVVQATPIIAVQPTSQSVALGANVTLAVQATGSAPLTYQWQKAGVPLDGQTGSTLQLYNVQWVDAQTYTVTVSNPLGTLTSAPAVLTVGGVTEGKLFNPYQSGSSFRAYLITAPGKTYVWEFKNYVTDPVWVQLLTIVGDGKMAPLTDLTPRPQRFYRVH